MAKTHLDIRGTSFFIDGKATYSETAGTNPAAHGLLMNARFIQGVFDDASDPSRFARFGRDTWDADQNTAELIAALPQWYHTGLRAFTVGFQGGRPFFTMGNHTIVK